MIVDYFLIKKQQLDLVSLYKTDGIYPAFNFAGLIAFAIPVAITVLSFSLPFLSWFYSYGWFTGAFTGAILYFVFANAKFAQTEKEATA